MGSLNSDGTRISQSREMVRNIGRANTVSADRTETETNLDQAPEAASDELGTNADLTTSQYSAVAISEAIKVSTPVGDDLISREYEQVIESPVHQNPPWVGLDGASDLESVLAQGNTGSGIVLTEALILGSADTDGVRLEINSGHIDFKEGNDSTYLTGAIRTGRLLTVDIIGGTGRIDVNGNGNALDMGSAIELKWSSSTNSVNSKDTGLKRSAAGIVQVTDGSTGLGAMRARRHVEVVTMASGEAITLAAASGQVIIVKGSNTREVNLPSGASLGLIYDIKDGDGTASSGNITVDGNGATIDGEASFALDVNYASYTFVYNGTEWNLI